LSQEGGGGIMEWSGTSWVRCVQQVQSQSYNNNNNNNNDNNNNNNNNNNVPPNPAQTYTQYYHGWKKRAEELTSYLRVSHNGHNNDKIENDRQWATYCTDESLRAAHHFQQRPYATLAPFSLPPAPPTTTTTTASLIFSILSSSNSIGSLKRYVKRNMERDEVENCPHLNKLVQDEIEKKVHDAIIETKGNLRSKNWDDIPLILSFDSLNRYTKRNMERHEIENNPKLKKLVQAEIEEQLDVARRDGTLQSKNWDDIRLIYSEKEPTHQKWNDDLIRNDLGKCVICLHSQRTCSFEPCGHICACQYCSQDFLGRNNQCPICKKKSTSIMKVYPE
jgi:hypothetical protein